MMGTHIQIRNFLINISLIGGSICMTLLACEVALRVIAYFDVNYLDNLVSQRELDPARDDQLGDIVRLHPDNKIVFELRPLTTGTFVGHPLSINSLGMRDRERNLNKPPETFRILALGDSHTFGWGVRQEETWPAVLENKLLEHFPDKKIEVMNLGVPGYNAVQQVQAFSAKAEQLNPDMVVVNYCNNDMDLPNFLASPPDPLTLNTSYLFDFLDRRISLLKGKIVSPLGLDVVPMDNDIKRFRMPIERIPERFRPLYGWENMIDAYERLAEQCRRMDIPYLFLLNFNDYRFRLADRTPTVVPKYVRDLIQQLKEEGYLVVDPQDRVFNYLKQNNLDHTAVWITKEDSHTNAIRHNLLAEEMFDHLKKNDF